MSFAENIKARIKDADVEKQLVDLVDDGERIAREAITRAGDVAHERRGEVEGWLEKATGVVNEKTEGKYADKVSAVRDTLLEGLGKLAQRRTPEPTTPSEPPKALTEGDDQPGDAGVDPAAPDTPA